MRNKRKFIAILVCLSFVMSLLVPMSALAYTENRVQTVPTLSDDADDVQQLGTLTLKEDSDYTEDLIAGKSFTVTFPSGVKLQNSVVEVMYGSGWALIDNDLVKKSGDYTLDVQLPDNFGSEENGVRITPSVKIDGFDGGDIEVTVDGFDSGITSGIYVLGRVGDGETSARVLAVPTVGEGDAKGGLIRITENSINAIDTGANEITLKLPANFSWNKADVDVDFLAGLSGVSSYTKDINGRTLTIGFNAPKDRTQRGIIQITPAFSASSDAKYGDVEVALGGDVTSADLIIAKYADYGVNVASSGDMEEVLAGQMDAELTDLLIKENVAGSLLDNRKTRIEFPDGVKIVDFATSGVKNINKNDLDQKLQDAIDGTDNYVEFVVPEASGKNSKREFKVEFTVSIEADFAGDIVAEVSGRAGAEGEATLGVASAPVTVDTSESKNLSIGLRDQEIGDITITETVDEAIMYENDFYGKGELLVVLPEGIDWSRTPDVEVTEGNLEIDTKKIDIDDNVLYIPIKSDSSKPSQITITNAEVDLDRTIPEGAVKVKIQGSAVVENFEKGFDPYDSASWTLDDEAGLFDTYTVASAEVARVATPAPGEQKNVALFTIGESSYTLNGVEVAMDVAPYLQNDRTYLPVRFVANVCGVSDDNIMWNPDDYSVVMIKGDRIVKLVIGSNTMLINGVPFNMDVAPNIVDPGRTMMPLRWVAQALGCSVEWDPVNYTVTVQ